MPEGVDGELEVVLRAGVLEDAWRTADFESRKAAGDEAAAEFTGVVRARARIVCGAAGLSPDPLRCGPGPESKPVPPFPHADLPNMTPFHCPAVLAPSDPLLPSQSWAHSAQQLQCVVIEMNRFDLDPMRLASVAHRLCPGGVLVIVWSETPQQVQHVHINCDAHSARVFTQAIRLCLALSRFR